MLGRSRSKTSSPEPEEVEPDALPLDPRQVRDKVENGEYFREMRNAYASTYLDSMTDRYFYMLITAITIVIAVFIIGAFIFIFPLQEDRPYLQISDNIWEELPTVRALKTSSKEDPNLAIRRFLLTEYVVRREAYDINKLDENVRFIRANSAQGVFDAWQKQLDPSSAESPITLYQRHSTRNIKVLSVSPGTQDTVEAAFAATVIGPDGQKTTNYVATIAFQFTDVTIDQKSGGATPVKFMVTDYRTRRLQE